MAVFSENMTRYKEARKFLEPFLNMLIKYSVIDAEKIPRNGSAIVIANHRSDLDPLVIGATFNRYIAWLGAAYDFKIPVIGNFLKELGMIPISGEKKDQINAFKEISRLVKSGRLVGIFPEGDGYITKNDFSLRLGDFHPGFARYALKLKVDILPVTVVGVKENIEAWGVPRFIREALGMPPHVVGTKNRLAFKEVKIIVNDTIAIGPYLDMKPDEAVEKLIERSKETIVETIRKHGEIERRMTKERQSGTRIFPEERLS